MFRAIWTLWKGFLQAPSPPAFPQNRISGPAGLRLKRAGRSLSSGLREARSQAKMFSFQPLFSEAPYFCPKVRFCKVKQIKRFQYLKLTQSSNSSCSEHLANLEQRRPLRSGLFC
jgi:hypothetical protein